MFQKPEFFSSTKFANTTFVSSMNDWRYIPFYASCYFFIFQPPHVFRKFSAFNLLFVAKISCVVCETIFKRSFCNNEIFLIWFTGCYTTALYTMFAVQHLLSSGHSALFLQLRPWLLEVGWIILGLWETVTEPIFLQQL